MKKCNGLLAFEQIAGLLIRSPKGYRFVCETCGYRGTTKKQPVPGTRCKRTK